MYLEAQEDERKVERTSSARVSKAPGLGTHFSKHWEGRKGEREVSLSLELSLPRLEVCR